jgi:hypothetical protein
LSRRPCATSRRCLGNSAYLCSACVERERSWGRGRRVEWVRLPRFRIACPGGRTSGIARRLAFHGIRHLEGFQILVGLGSSQIRDTRLKLTPPSPPKIQTPTPDTV